MIASAVTSNVVKLREFYRAVISGEKPDCVSVYADSLQELLTLFDKALVAQQHLGAGAKVGGTNPFNKHGFYLSVAGSRFTVLPNTMKKKGVAQTSRQAYHELNVGEATIKMAEVALAVQEKVGYCTDLLVAQEMSVSDGRVSARRNDIEKIGCVTVGGESYSLVWGDKVKNRSTGKTVRSWTLQKQGQQSLF